RHRDVVDHRKRLGADADHVVDVHGDAVDADGVVFAHHVGDNGFRADAVGAERKADAVELDHVGEIADRQHHAAEPRRRPGALHARDDAVQARIRLRGVDAAVAVDFVAHVGFSACCTGAAALILRRARSARLEGWGRPHASRRPLRGLLSMRPIGPARMGPPLEKATMSARLPAIYCLYGRLLHSSCPGLTRASIEKSTSPKGWIAGSSPAMTTDGSVSLGLSPAP